MASDAVRRRPAKTGVVGSWLGTGFRTSQPQGGPKMAIQISHDFMALEAGGAVIATARFSQYAAADGNGA
jgi:hypothetical protein